MEGEHPEHSNQELVHLPLEMVNQQIDNVVNLYADRHNPEYQAGYFDSSMLKFASDMATWDADSRKRFMVGIIQKEFDASPQSFADFNQRQHEGRSFPLGVEVSPGFLAVMSPELRSETFWDAVTELSRDVDFANGEDNRPMVIRKFISHALSRLPRSERQSIEHEMVGEFAHNPDISDDGRWQVVGSYLHSKYLIGGVSKEWQSYSVEGSKPQDPLEHFQLLQRDIAGVVCDLAIKDKFRGSILENLCYDALDGQTMGSIENVILEPGQSITVGLKVMRWIGFRSDERADGGQHACETMQKVVEMRSDAPELQLSSMGWLLRRDHRDREDEQQYSDFDKFAEIAAKAAKTNPEALKNEGVFFYSSLALFPKGREIVQSLILEGHGLEQFMAVQSAFETHAIDIPAQLLSDALRFIAESYEQGADESYLHSFFHKLNFSNRQLSQADYFMLARIKAALQKFDWEKTQYEFHSAESASGHIDDILAKSMTSN